MTHQFKASTITLAAALTASAAVGPLAAQQPHPRYTRDLPAALMRQAKVPEQAAAKTAAARIPNGRIQGVELENERGRLIYSYELKVPGRSGIEEVNVNAKTGKVVNTEHEGPSAEKAEAVHERGSEGGRR